MHTIAQAADPGWLDLLADAWNRWHDQPAFWLVLTPILIAASLYLYNFIVGQAVKAKIPGAAGWLWTRRFRLGVAEQIADYVRWGWYASIAGAILALAFAAWVEVDGDFRRWFNFMVTLAGLVYLGQGVSYLMRRLFSALTGGRYPPE